ncbi:MAG: hypothetical protein CBB71_23320 [Rhodopirellula sp. TMED11]|nr:MAG: hypothetical protein CBB71_23320 [Rhodopirellula sp. TMED11]
MVRTRSEVGAKKSMAGRTFPAIDTITACAPLPKALPTARIDFKPERGEEERAEDAGFRAECGEVARADGEGGRPGSLAEVAVGAEGGGERERGEWDAERPRAFWGNGERPRCAGCGSIGTKPVCFGPAPSIKTSGFICGGGGGGGGGC